MHWVLNTIFESALKMERKALNGELTVKKLTFRIQEVGLFLKYRIV